MAQFSRTTAQIDAILDDVVAARGETSLANAITNKQDALTFDLEPTQNSTNPVTSGGVYAALGGIMVRKISKTDFDALETKNPDTVYYVIDNYGKVEQYLGTVGLDTGGKPTIGTAPAVAKSVNVQRIKSTQIYNNNPSLILTITELRAETNCGQFAELRFYDENMERIALSVDMATSNRTPMGQNESAEKVLDNNIATKWCWSWANPTTLTVALNENINLPAYMSYVTANDETGRDPVSFTLEYREKGISRTLLSVSGAEITTARRAETQLFPCDVEEA